MPNTTMWLAFILVAILAALTWLWNDRAKTIEGQQLVIAELQGKVEGLEASESLLLSRLKASDISLKATREKQQELEKELKGKEKIVKEYIPVEVTNESNCLDLRPPADLIDRLRSDS